jgi:hypothetical protein
MSMSMGSVQRLDNGSTLVGFGGAGRVAEIAGERVSWEATLATDGAVAPIPFYRAVGMHSLYGYKPDVGRASSQ